VTIITPDRLDFGTLARVARIAVELEAAVPTATAMDPADMCDAELTAVVAVGDPETISLHGGSESPRRSRTGA
jgi:hypothetical protein